MQKLRVRNNRIITFPRMELMGIVNVTPDSFYAASRTLSDGRDLSEDHSASDGGADPWDKAFALARKHIADGARFIDVGGESTRPGALPVTADEEIERICPVISRIREAYPEVVISADTYRAKTAEAALQAGADMINDISGLTFEPELAEVIAAADAAVVVMHTAGRPETMQQDPHYEDVVEEVYQFLRRQTAYAAARGIGWDQIMIDLGIGFGKTADHNLQLLRHIDRFDQLGCPHLMAVSRKSFIGKTLGREDPEDRLPGTLALTAWGAAHGIAAARVHDVRENMDMIRMLEVLNA